MNFKLDVYFHLGDNFLQLLAERMDTMSAELDTLKTEIESLIEVDKSVIALIEDLAAKFEAVKNDPVAIQSLVDEVRAEKQELTDVVLANTPAE